MRHGVAHARFVGVGIARPEWVDKHAVWGSVFENVDAELAGIPQTISCECGALLTVQPGRSAMPVLKRHIGQKVHQKWAEQNPEAMS